LNAFLVEQFISDTLVKHRIGDILR